MTTQAELAQQIAALTEQNEKARSEVLAKISDMQAALPDGHFKFPHLWPLKLPQAGRSDYGFPDPV